MKPEAIFFDLDDTLVRLDIELADTRSRAAFREIEAAAGIEAATLFAAHRSVVPAVWRSAESRVIDHGETIDGLWVMLETYRQALLIGGCDDEGLARRALDFYWENRHGVIQSFDEARDVLQQLQGHYRLAVITNGPSITQLDKLQVNGLDRYFDLVLASGDVGFAKPDATVFRLALEDLGVSASQTWHVGDNPVSDVLGAHNAGLTSVWINRKAAERQDHHPEPHHEIASLRELVVLLEDAI
jgi:putative hydrolase of the HAD superfamily